VTVITTQANPQKYNEVSKISNNKRTQVPTYEAPHKALLEVARAPPLVGQAYTP
ncbi:hypothetical protein KI387_036673, partial [Taxus chinensis]